MRRSAVTSFEYHAWKLLYNVQWFWVWYQRAWCIKTGKVCCLNGRSTLADGTFLCFVIITPKPFAGREVDCSSSDDSHLGASYSSSLLYMIDSRRLRPCVNVADEYLRVLTGGCGWLLITIVVGDLCIIGLEDCWSAYDNDGILF